LNQSEGVKLLEVFAFVADDLNRQISEWEHRNGWLDKHAGWSLLEGFARL
jgi:hypothetical protein